MKHNRDLNAIDHAGPICTDISSSPPPSPSPPHTGFPSVGGKETSVEVSPVGRKRLGRLPAGFPRCVPADVWRRRLSHLLSRPDICLVHPGIPRTLPGFHGDALARCVAVATRTQGQEHTEARCQHTGVCVCVCVYASAITHHSHAPTHACAEGVCGY